MATSLGSFFNDQFQGELREWNTLTSNDFEIHNIQNPKAATRLQQLTTNFYICQGYTTRPYSVPERQVWYFGKGEQDQQVSLTYDPRLHKLKGTIIARKAG